MWLDFLEYSVCTQSEERKKERNFKHLYAHLLLLRRKALKICAQGATETQPCPLLGPLAHGWQESPLCQNIFLTSLFTFIAQKLDSFYQVKLDDK